MVVHGALTTATNMKPCTGCGMPHDHEAISIYGHGRICGYCAIVEEYEGDFITRNVEEDIAYTRV